MKAKKLDITIPSGHHPVSASLADLRTVILLFFDFGDCNVEDMLTSVLDCAKGLYAQAIDSGTVHLAREKDKIICEVVYKASDFVKGRPLEHIARGVGSIPGGTTKAVWEFPLPQPSS